MRADRLISIVMLLQTHERMTAKELSRELEVSQRTIYRDIDALNLAGIPIYTDRGPAGGIALLESYRTTLTGISEDEARALFMLSIPEALVELGVGQKLKTALYKLAVAMPQVRKSVRAETQQRIYLDTTGWTSNPEPVVHLEVINQAIWQVRMLRILFSGSFNARIEIETAPLGLVSKLNSWYLIGLTDDHIRVFSVKDILDVQLLEQDFSRDENFNLMETWLEWCKGYQGSRPAFHVEVKVSPKMINLLCVYLGEEINYEIGESAPGKDNGWKMVKIVFENFFQARKCILNMGRAVEVLEPEALKLSVIDFARQIIDLYQEKY